MTTATADTATADTATADTATADTAIPLFSADDNKFVVTSTCSIVLVSLGAKNDRTDYKHSKWSGY